MNLLYDVVTSIRDKLKKILPNAFVLELTRRSMEIRLHYYTLQFYLVKVRF